MTYVAQVIIAFPVSVEDKSLIEKSINALNDKAKANGLPSFAGVLKTKPADRQSVQLLKTFFGTFGSSRSGVRVYLIGHANWLSHRIGIWSSEEVADLLSAAGFSGHGVISLIGCEAALNLDDEYPPAVEDWEESLATKLHFHLKRKHSIAAVIHARIKPVGVFSDLHKDKFENPRDFAGLRGRKFVLLKDDVRSNKHPETKLVFYWEGETQKRRWAY